MLSPAEQACIARAPQTGGVDPTTVTVTPTSSTKIGDTIYTVVANGIAYNCVASPDGTVLELPAAVGRRAEVGRLSALGGLEPYAPLGVLKPLGRDIWMVDGPVVRKRCVLGSLPLTTRMTVARLPDGRLWLHAPVELTPGLAAEIRALGRVAALVAPNRLRGEALGDWQAAFPGAVTWGAPGLAEDGGGAAASASTTSSTARRRAPGAGRSRRCWCRAAS